MPSPEITTSTPSLAPARESKCLGEVNLWTSRRSISPMSSRGSRSKRKTHKTCENAAVLQPCRQRTAERAVDDLSKSASLGTRPIKPLEPRRRIGSVEEDHRRLQLRRAGFFGDM